MHDTDGSRAVATDIRENAGLPVQLTGRVWLITRLYDGLTFVARQSRELGAYLHPELSVVTHSLLSFINAEPDARAVDIAASYGLDKSTVSRQLNQVEHAGLVTRDGERAGRRGHALTLTSEGARVLERAAASSRSRLAEHLADWSDQDIATLGRLLARFQETAPRAPRLD